MWEKMDTEKPTRCFVAVEIPNDYYNELYCIQKKFDKICKKTDVKSFHITLCFLGDVFDIDKIRLALKEIKTDSFDVELSCLGYFGGRFPKVLWVGINSENLKELSNKIHQKLKVQPDFEYSPHLTLARIKECLDNKAFKETLLSINYTKTFRVREFFLFSSKLMPDGPVYSIIEKYKLI